MNKEAANWLSSAEYDLETAGNMLDSGRYIYTVFMCHLAIEKLTKAVIVEMTGKEPPRSHDLQYLLGLSGLEPDSSSQEFVAELSNLSVATRYPVDFERALSDFSKERAEGVFRRTKETFGWIKQQIG
jgi:HEPN domain-containing protein